MRLLIISLACLLWGCASNGTSHSGGHGSPRVASANTSAGVEVVYNDSANTSAGIEVVFSDSEIRTIRAYYETHESYPGHGKGKSKGKAGGKDLPPGIARNLSRGKPLPPGIAKHSLPYELQRRLPAPPTGFERIVVAGKILLIEVATQVVRDMLTDAMFG